MTWTAIVPIKPPEARKTRLATIAPVDRERLTEDMLDHVLAVLGAHPDIGSIVLLTDRPRHGHGWIEDRGRGLNAELKAARAMLATDLLVIHADLPLVGADDISTLLTAAETHGAAIACDRHGSGTNAVALRASTSFAFNFGADSRRLHGRQLASPDAIVTQPGLGFDIDTQDDMRLADTFLTQGKLVSCQD